MPKINPLVSLFFLISVLISIFITTSLFGVRRVYDSGISQTDRLVPLFTDKPISQQINPLQNGLNTIYVYMRNRSILNTSPVRFLLSDDTGNALRQIDINGSNIGDGENVRFQFLPISDSAGRSYIVTLSTSKNSSNEPHVEIGFTKDKMSYLANYRPTNKKILFKNIMLGLIPKLNQPRLYIIALLVGGFNCYLLSLLIQKSNENK